MSGNWGKNIGLSIFGESHGPAIGINISGLPGGIPLDMDDIAFEMGRRAPGNSPNATARRESDTPEIVSGLFEGRTTGAPLCAIIRNQNTRGKDYSQLRDLMRPGHADYPATVRYGGYHDHRGGGHFSGRITAPLTFAGAVCKQILRQKGVEIYAHLLQIAGVFDNSFADTQADETALAKLKNSEIPTLRAGTSEEMQGAIAAAKADGDSVGGVVECMVTGLPAGVGDPFFDSVESTLSHLLFSVPGVKGVSFGDGFACAGMRGSQFNDPYTYKEGGITATSNHSGGLLGGITNGMPVVFQAALRPTASIAKEQDTVSLKQGQDAKLKITGRHDPCIAPRALPVIEACAAIAVLEQLGNCN